MPGISTPQLLSYSTVVDVDMDQTNDVNLADIEDYGHRVMIEMDGKVMNDYLGWKRDVGEARPSAHLDTTKEAAFTAALEAALSGGFVDIDGVTGGLHFGSANLDTNTDSRLRAGGVISANDLPLCFVLYRLYGNSSVGTLDNILNLQDAHGMLENQSVATAIVNSFKGSESGALDRMFRDLLAADPHRFFNSEGIPETGIFETRTDLQGSGRWKITDDDVVEIKTKLVFKSKISRRGVAGREHLLSATNSGENQQTIINPDDYFYVRLQIKAIKAYPTAPVGLSATTGDGSITLNFSEGAARGSAITNYQYSTDGSNYVNLNPASTTSPITITGLTNGTSYTIYLRAINASGEGDVATIAATPAAVPSAPTGLNATKGDGSIQISFTSGASNGAAITNYKYSLDDVNYVAFNPAVTTSPVTITGLTNGTEYTVYLKAVNVKGDGAAASISATPSTIPSAPTDLIATEGNESVQISFTEGTSGGSAITNYKYSLDGVNYVALSPEDNISPVGITGLTNGVTYTIYLKAVNENGDSSASSSVSAIPRPDETIPFAPSHLNATTGDGSIQISFTQEGDGGSAITNYKYSIDGTNYTAFDPAVTTSPVFIGGLTNGTNYTVYLKAVNAIGDSVASSVSATPSTVPSAPTGLSAVAGNGSIQISFTAGADGSSAITNYKYSIDGTSYVAFDPAVTTSPVTIGGLTNGTNYTVYLKAVNANGDGAASDSASATPSTIPSAPTNLSVSVEGDGNLQISFTEGANGGSAITNYKYSIDGTTYVAFDGAQTTSPVTIGGLTNGTSYLVYLKAVNENGDSAASIPTSGTPSTNPSQPTGLSAVAGDGSLQISFTEGANGGSAITNYKYSLDGMNYIAFNPAQASSPVTVGGLTNGTEYTVYLKAVNKNGDSAEYDTVTATPSTVPSAPTSLSALTSDGSIQVTFTGAADGGSAITNYKYSIDGTTYVAFDPAVTTSPVTIGGLSNGTEYTIRLKAVNANGDGSAASVTATPSTTPSEPTNVSATIGDGSIQINFTEGANGGSAITNYKYSFDGTTFAAFNPAQTTSPISFGGLTNGTEYTLYLKAVNANGDSPAVSVTATPAIVAFGPSAPTDLIATTADSAIQVSFTTGDDGGSTITNYKYSLDGTNYIAFSPAVTSSPVGIGGLTNGTSYTIYLKAVNANGDSVASTSVTATPVGVITATNKTISNFDVSTYYQAPTNGLVSLATDATFSFNFFGTEYGQGKTGADGIQFGSNNVLLFGSSDVTAPWSAATGKGILLGHAARTVDALYTLPVYSVGIYRVQAYFIAFRDTAAGVANGGQMQLRLVKNLVSLKQYIEVSVIKGSGSKMAGLITTPGTWDITDGAEFKGTFGSSFGAAFPADRTSFVLTSDATGSSWTFTNSAKLDLTESSLLRPLAVYDWYNILGGTSAALSSSTIRNVYNDANNNVYLTGTYQATLSKIYLRNFHTTGATSSSTAFLPSTTSTAAFLAKYNSSGTAQWAVAIDGTNSDTVFGVTTDSAGNVYATGTYVSTTVVTLKDATGTATGVTLPIATGTASFLIKYNSSGIPQWAVAIDGTTNDFVYGIAIDSTGNIYLTGQYISSTATITLKDAAGANSSVILPIAATNSMLLLKYDPAGTPLWAIVTTGSGTCTGNSVKIDSAGNILVAGTYISTAAASAKNADGTTSAVALPVTTTSSCALVLKYNSQGLVQWVASVDGSTSDTGLCVVTDPSNNVYLSGAYASTTTTTLKHANGTNSSTIFPTVGSNSTYVVKYDSTGNVSWGATIDGTAADTAYSVAVDSTGAVYMCGAYNSTGTITVKNANGTNSSVVIPATTSTSLGVIFVKYSSTGTVQWGTSFDTAQVDMGYGVSVDSLDNIYIGGVYTGSTNQIILKNASGANTSVILSPTSGTTAFSIKYDAAGTPLSSTVFVVGSSNYSFNNIKLDSSNNIYICGRYAGNAILLPNLDGTTSSILLPSTLSDSIFLMKYNSSGILQWAVAADGIGNEVATSLSVDSAGNVYITGAFNNTPLLRLKNAAGVDTAVTLPSVTTNAVYIIQYNSAGTPQWANTIDGTGTDNGTNIYADSTGNIYLTGTYISSTAITLLDAAGVATSNVLPTATANAAFLIKYNSSGLPLWAITIDGTSNESATNVTLDSAGNIYLVGFYNSTSAITLKNAAGTDSGIILPVSSSTEAFLIKYNSAGSPIWAQTVKGTSTDNGNSVAVDSAGDIYFVGYYSSTSNIQLSDIAGNILVPYLRSTSTIACYLIKYNSAGTPLWATSIDGTGTDMVANVILDREENPYICGSFTSTSTVALRDAVTGSNTSIVIPASNSTAGLIVKYDKLGAPQWFTLGDTSASTTENAPSIAFDTSNNLYAVVTSTGNLGTFHIRNAGYTGTYIAASTAITGPAAATITSAIIKYIQA